MEQTAAEHVEPSAAAGIKVAQLPFDAPWTWLAAGWRDMWSAPQISLPMAGLSRRYRQPSCW